MAENLNLGDKITLTGFKDEEGSTMIIIKKMVGNYVKKIMDDHDNFQHISISLKKVHAHPDRNGGSKGGKSEIHVKVDAGKIYTSEVVDFNIFVALDKAFKKTVAEM